MDRDNRVRSDDDTMTEEDFARWGWRYRLGGLVGGAGRPQDASAPLVLAALYSGGGLVNFAVAGLPINPNEPARLAVVLGILDLLMSAALLVSRRRLRPVALHLSLTLRVVFAVVLVARAASPTGVAMVGFALVCIVLYAAYFFTRVAARVHTALAVAGFVVGTVVGGVHRVAVVVLVVVLFLVVAEELSGTLNTRLRLQGRTDGLTGLANRSWFRLAASREIADADRRRRPFSLVLLDLDDFKSVNDAGGHRAGDTLLVELTRSWQSRLRRDDLLARYGGDEFAILLRDTTATQTTPLLDELRAAHPMSWSAGVACWTPGTDLDAMFEQADQDLYRAKGLRHIPRSRRSAAQLRSH
jgi:diguanylate cyclase (GGDEF)-like protein